MIKFSLAILMFLSCAAFAELSPTDSRRLERWRKNLIARDWTSHPTLPEVLTSAEELILKAKPGGEMRSEIYRELTKRYMEWTPLLVLLDLEWAPNLPEPEMLDLKTNIQRILRKNGEWNALLLLQSLNPQLRGFGALSEEIERRWQPTPELLAQSPKVYEAASAAITQIRILTLAPGFGSGQASFYPGEWIANASLNHLVGRVVGEARNNIALQASVRVQLLDILKSCRAQAATLPGMLIGGKPVQFQDIAEALVFRNLVQNFSFPATPEEAELFGAIVTHNSISEDFINENANVYLSQLPDTVLQWLVFRGNSYYNLSRFKGIRQTALEIYNERNPNRPIYEKALSPQVEPEYRTRHEATLRDCREIILAANFPGTNP